MNSLAKKDGNQKGYAALFITSTVWGTTWVASKIGVNEIPALQMAYIRQFIAGLCFLLSSSCYIREPPANNQTVSAWITVMAILMFVFANGLSTWSLKYIPTGLSALIGALYPLSVIIREIVLLTANR